MKRPSAVLDTNVVVSGLIVPKSKPGRLISAWKRNEFQLITSVFLLDELGLVLKRPIFLNKYSLKLTAIDNFITRIKRRSLLIEHVKPYDISLRDQKDLIVVATAIDAHADYLVTGDKDLLEINRKELPQQLRILSVRDFLNVFEAHN